MPDAYRVWYARCMGRRLQYLDTLQQETSRSTLFLTRVRSTIQQSDSSRRRAYLHMNTSLEAHPATNPWNRASIPEQNHIALTRIRLASHLLRIETGRWSRIPRENRLCNCRTDIQTEDHVLLRCTIMPNRHTNRRPCSVEMHHLERPSSSNEY